MALKKLSDQFLGPYEILARPGTHSVTLRLLGQSPYCTPVFHISILEPATPNLIQIESSPHLCWLQWTMNQIWNSEILDTKIENWHCAWKFYTLSDGLFMRALMKKHLDPHFWTWPCFRTCFQLHLASLPNLAPCWVFPTLNSGVLHFLEITLVIFMFKGFHSYYSTLLM